jgi:trigger factor
MKLKIQKLPDSELELKIELSTEEFEKFFNKAIFELGKDLETPGFRKGKLPKEIIEKEIGRERILREAAEMAVRENYLKVISQKNLEVLGRPKIEILKLAPGNPFEFKIIVPVLPEIKLPDYKKIASEVKRKEIIVSEGEITETLSWIAKSRSKFIPKEEGAREGDFIEIEYNSSQVENGRKIKDQFILGRGGLIPEFETNLKGMKSAEEKQVSLTFPENHFRKDLAGKRADFKIKMVSVQRVEVPEISDEFARGLGKFENLAGLKKSISEGIKLEKEIQESERVRKEILERMSKATDMEIPKILVEEQKKRYLEDLKKQVLDLLKTDFRSYLKEINKTEKELLDSFQDQAKNQIKNLLILREIQKEEKIEPSEEEIKREVNEILREYSTEQAQKLDLERLKSYTKERIGNEKTLRFLEGFTKP